MLALTRPTLRDIALSPCILHPGSKEGGHVQVGQRGMPGNATLQQAAAALATPKPSAQKGPSQRNKQVPDLHFLRMPAFWEAALPAMPLLLSIASPDVSCFVRADTVASWAAWQMLQLKR